MLETQRLQLLPWAESDIDAFRPIATDPRVMRYINGGVPWTEEQIREFVTRQIGHHNDLGYCMWKLMDKATGELCGFCGIQPLRGTEETEIGWWLAGSHWGRGLATEAAREALQNGFQRAGLQRIVAVAMPENAASRHVMEKIGMEFEKVVELRGYQLVMYALRRP